MAGGAAVESSSNTSTVNVWIRLMNPVKKMNELLRFRAFSEI